MSPEDYHDAQIPLEHPQRYDFVDQKSSNETLPSPGGTASSFFSPWRPPSLANSYPLSHSMSSGIDSTLSHWSLSPPKHTDDSIAPSWSSNGLGPLDFQSHDPHAAPPGPLDNASDIRSGPFDAHKEDPFLHVNTKSLSARLPHTEGNESPFPPSVGLTDHRDNRLYLDIRSRDGEQANTDVFRTFQTPSQSTSTPYLSPDSQLSQSNSFENGLAATMQSSMPEYSIFVGDLCPELRDEDLVASFLHPPHWPASHPFAIAHAHAQQAQGIYSTPPKVAPAPFTSTKSATIMTDPITGASRGFGFVRFSSEADCSRALIEMQGIVISPSSGQGGRPLRVCPALPKNRSSSMTASTAAGPMSDKTIGHASHYPNVKIGGTYTPSPGISTPAEQPMATPFPSSAKDPNNTTVFVGGLSSLISEETLRTFFVPFGEIKYVKIPPGKGCGFVQFVRKADAERAIERMQGFPIGGGRIRLSWGRSQGDKAAAAAAQAAAQAAHMDHLAALAHIPVQNTSQFSAYQISPNGLSAHDTNPVLRGAGPADYFDLDKKPAHTYDVVDHEHLRPYEYNGYRPSPSYHLSHTPPNVHGSHALRGSSLINSLAPPLPSSWPDYSSTSKGSPVQGGSSLATLLASMNINPQPSDHSALRERSQTFTVGSRASYGNAVMDNTAGAASSSFPGYSFHQVASKGALDAERKDGPDSFRRSTIGSLPAKSETETYKHTSSLQPFNPFSNLDTSSLTIPSPGATPSSAFLEDKASKNYSPRLGNHHWQE